MAVPTARREGEPMTKIENVQAGPLELLRNAPGLVSAAAKAGMGLSLFMEKEDRTEKYTGRDAQMDAFTRGLAAAGIVTQSIPALGLYSTTWSDLLDGTAVESRGLPVEASRLIAGEYLLREWQSAKFGTSADTRNILTTVVDNVNPSQRPYIDAAIASDQESFPVPLADIIAVETAINGKSYSRIVYDEEGSDLHGSPVNEGAEIPKSILSLTDESFNLRKYGNSLEWTYEVELESGIDRIGFFVREMSRTAEWDKLGEATTAIYNNPNVETLQNSVLGGDTTNDVLTLEAFLNLAMKFNRGISFDTVLGLPAHIVEFLMMKMSPTGEQTLFEMGTTPFGTLRKLGDPLGIGDLAWGAIDGAPANALVFLNRGSAVERISQIGATVSEMESFITRQTRVMTFTEAEAFHVIVPSAVKIVDLDS